MPSVWRICRARFADLSGNGAQMIGGRWNSPGRAVVYAARDAALAVLEVRVHLDLPSHQVPDDYLLVRIEFDNVVAEILHDTPDMPRDIGDDWLRSGRSALLQVPSVIVPESSNILINPAHPDAAEIRIASSRPFRFDDRLWSAGSN